MLVSFTVLRHRQIRLLWLGQLLSAFGDRFFEIAVVWISVQIVGSEAGFVLAAGAAARLATGLLGGVFADRWDRQKSMVWVDTLRALAIVSLPISAAAGGITLGQLALVAAIAGALSSVFEPALQASLPKLTENSKDLQASNALLDVTSRLARIFAPGMAGLIITLLPIEQFFTLDAITFAVSAISLLIIGRGFRWQDKSDAGEEGGFGGIVRALRAAVVLAHQNRAVFWSILSYVPANIVWGGAIMVGLALLANGDLDAGVQGYSFLITAYGVGSVISNIVVGSRTVANRARLFFAGIVVFGLGILLLGLSRAYVMAALAMFVASLGTPMSDLMILIMIQEEFPSNQVGKVYSLRLTISSIGYSVGLLIAAPMFKLVPVATGMLWYGVIALLVGLVGMVRFRKPAAHGAAGPDVSRRS